MSSTYHANATHQKLSALKRKLYLDGYRFPIEVESLPLIEKLYADLQHSKDSLKKVKTDRAQSEIVLNSEHLEICKNENAKVLRENSNLRNRLIKLQEDTEHNVQEIKAEMKKLERENLDLKFLNNQYSRQAVSLENESRQKSERILQLEDKNSQASIHIPAGRKKNYLAFRNQKMEIDCHLPPSSGTSSNKHPDQYTINLLKVAEDNVEKLRSEVGALTSDNENLRNKAAALAKQVETRDAEIDRLAKGGEPNDVMLLEAKNKSNEKTIVHLNSQIDILQKQLSELEVKVGQRRSVWTDEGDINVEHLTSSSDSELRRLRQEVNQKQEEIHRLNTELTEREKESRSNMVVEAKQRHVCDELLIKLQEDKRVLGVRVSQLTANEKELVLEMDRLKHQRPRAPQPCRKTACKSTSSTNQSVKALEEERDYYKEEVDTLNKVLSTISLHKSQGYASMSSGWRSGGNSPINRNCSCSASLNFGRDSRCVVEEMRRIQEERDELRRKLDDYERHFSEFKDELIDRRTLDKDSLRMTSANLTSGSQTLLRRFEEEKEDALVRVRNLKGERDELMRKIQEMDEIITGERRKFERNLSELKSALSESELSKRNFNFTVENNAAEVKLRGQLREAKDEAAQHRATAVQMKSIADQAEQMLREKEGILSGVQAELRSERSRADKVEKKMEAADKERSNMCNEVERLRRSLERMDGDKDGLQMELDVKLEAETKLQEALQAKSERLRELEMAIGEADCVLSKLKSNLISKDREVTELRQRLASSAEDLQFTEKLKDGLVNENRKLQEELASASKDIHSAKLNQQETAKLKNRLSAQAQDYLDEVKRCQELLTSKDREKHDILEQYSLLNSEVERLESRNHGLETEVSKVKLELNSREAEMRRMKDRCDRANGEFQDRMVVEQNHKVEISNLRKDVTTLEGELRRLADEKCALTSDLSAARDLISRLESGNSQLERSLAMKGVDNDRLQSLLESKKNEVDLQKEQISSEKEQIADLEGLLQSIRTKEWQMQMALQEKQAELQLLKDRVALNDNKIDSQNRELCHHRTKLVEMESEVEKLKRQLISEKFERERAMQLLKRNNLHLPGESRLGSISPERTSDGSDERSILKDDQGASAQIFTTM